MSLTILDTRQLVAEARKRGDDNANDYRRPAALGTSDLDARCRLRFHQPGPRGRRLPSAAVIGRQLEEHHRLHPARAAGDARRRARARLAVVLDVEWRE